jgi:small nuclear ribonucleoprotein B and B'
MLSLINHRLRITLLDTRQLTGQMLAFDKHMNLVLADCEEFRKIKSKKPLPGGKTTQDLRRALGLVILRGEIIVSIAVEGPPPVTPEEHRLRSATAAQMTAGPGMGRPAGRGMAMGPPGMAGAGNYNLWISFILFTNG